MAQAANKGQDKNYEIQYFDEWIRKYGNFEMYPDAEYQRILNLMGILNDKPTSLLLDVGCGTGAFSVRLSEKFRVVGVDLSYQAVKCANESKQANVDYVVADIEHLPFKKNIFDVGFVGGALHHCPDIIPQVAKELSKVISQDGKLYMLEPHARNLNNFYTFTFSKGPTVNEAALVPCKLEKIFKKDGFSNFEWKDIGDIIHIHPDNFSGAIKLKRALAFRLLRLFVLICIKFINRVPMISNFFPGAFFIASCIRHKPILKERQ